MASPAISAAVVVQHVYNIIVMRELSRVLLEYPPVRSHTIRQRPLINR